MLTDHEGDDFLGWVVTLVAVFVIIVLPILYATGKIVIR